MIVRWRCLHVYDWTMTLSACILLDDSNVCLYLIGRLIYRFTAQCEILEVTDSRLKSEESRVISAVKQIERSHGKDDGASTTQTTNGPSQPWTAWTRLMLFILRFIIHLALSFQNFNTILVTSNLVSLIIELAEDQEAILFIISFFSKILVDK